MPRTISAFHKSGSYTQSNNYQSWFTGKVDSFLYNNPFNKLKHSTKLGIICETINRAIKPTNIHTKNPDPLRPANGAAQQVLTNKPLKINTTFNKTFIVAPFDNFILSTYLIKFLNNTTCYTNNSKHEKCQADNTQYQY